MGARLERRLAAILAADVAGYSRLMKDDEADTFARLKRVRTDIVEPILAQHAGRVVDLKGDGALVEFQSVVDAVEAAVAIQRAMVSAEPDLPEDRRILFRIGINLGDVIVDGSSIYGDGVNVAARIESLCEPGGVWLSRSVYNEVKSKLDFDFTPSGLHHVKNISEAVETFRVSFDGSTPADRTRERRRAWQRPALIASALLCSFILGTAIWRLGPAEPSSDKPSVAVLPFSNLGGDDATGRLADGITEDIITDLARFHDLDVIARNSTELYKGKPVDVRQIGEDLHVGYALEGSIQRSGDHVRVTAQLIDARGGAHVWADRWDRPLADVFAVQSELAERVAGALGGNVGLGEITRNQIRNTKRKLPTDLVAYDYFMLGVEAKNLVTKESLQRAVDMLSRAVELDPSLARAYATRAWARYFSMMYGADGAAMLASMVKDAEQAVALDPTDPEALGALGYARLIQGRYAEAEGTLGKAIDFNPANGNVLTIAASAFALIGKPEQGAAFADRALRLDPRMSPANMTGAKDALFMARRYADVIAAVDRIPAEYRSRDAWAFLAVSHTELGQADAAAEAKAGLLSAFPTTSAERMLNEDYSFARQQDRDFFVESFRAAGLPVCMTAQETSSQPPAKPLAECQAARAGTIATRS